MYTNTLLATALAFTTALAAPSHRLTRRVDDGTQSCTCEDNGAYGTYSVNIGAPYDGNRCTDAYNQLTSNNQGVAPSNWQCIDDGTGHFQLWFDIAFIDGGISTRINPALGEVFPEINGFNCPDY